jgi:hypothetical protein
MGLPKYCLRPNVLNPLFLEMTQTELRRILKYKDPSGFVRIIKGKTPMRADKRRWLLDVFQSRLKRRPFFDDIFEKFKK